MRVNFTAPTFRRYKEARGAGQYVQQTQREKRWRKFRKVQTHPRKTCRLLPFEKKTLQGEGFDRQGCQQLSGSLNQASKNLLDRSIQKSGSPIICPRPLCESCHGQSTPAAVQPPPTPARTNFRALIRLRANFLWVRQYTAPVENKFLPNHPPREDTVNRQGEGMVWAFSISAVFPATSFPPLWISGRGNIVRTPSLHFNISGFNDTPPCRCSATTISPVSDVLNLCDESLQAVFHACSDQVTKRRYFRPINNK